MNWSHFKFCLWLALAGGVLAAGAAGAYSYRLPDLYESTATLLLVPLPVPRTFDQLLQAPDGDDWKAQAIRERVAEALTLPMDPPMPPQPRYQLSVPDYALLFRTQEMAQRVREFTQSRMAALAAGAPAASLEGFRNRMELRTRLLAQTRFDVVYQEALELSVRAEYPQIAAEATNFWAEQCIEYAAALRRERIARVEQFFDERLAALERQPESEGRETQRQILMALRATAGLDTADFLLAGEATPPSQPVAPQRAVFVLAAAFGGAFVVLTLAVLWLAARAAFPPSAPAGP